mgnify:CR=1 FL=1
MLKLEKYKKLTMLLTCLQKHYGSKHDHTCFNYTVKHVITNMHVNYALTYNHQELNMWPLRYPQPSSHPIPKYFQIHF